MSLRVAKITYRSLTAFAGVVTAIIIMALCNAYLGGAYLIWQMFVFGVFGENRWVQAFTASGLLWWFFYYAWHGSVASGDFWTLRITWTPAGMSSCTRNPYTSLPYNPNGLSDYTDAAYVTSHIDYCAYPEVRWGDNTGIPFNGTDENDILDPDPQPCTLCNMASQRPQDYAKNKGTGLSHGWYVGASPLDTMLCLGVERVLNDLGHIGKGRPVCAHCSVHFDPTSECDKPANDLLCDFWCPIPTPTVASDMRRAAEVMLSFTVVVSFYALATALVDVLVWMKVAVPKKIDPERDPEIPLAEVVKNPTQNEETKTRNFRSKGKSRRGT